MLHDRTWVVADVATAYDLAHKLTQQTWCLCQGFRLKEYLFLNDSTSEDGAQEYGVVHEKMQLQIESITFGWCDEETALKYIEQTLRGELAIGRIDDLKIETPEQHGECQYCA